VSKNARHFVFPQVSRVRQTVLKTAKTVHPPRGWIPHLPHVLERALAGTMRPSISSLNRPGKLTGPRVIPASSSEAVTHLKLEYLVPVWRLARPPRPRPGMRIRTHASHLPGWRRHPKRVRPRIDGLPIGWQKLNIVGTLISSMSVIAIACGLYLTYQDNREQRRLDTQAHVSDRFSRAIEQLGSSRLEVRLGGIYGLERLTRDSPTDQATAVEVLSAYVRERASVPSSETELLQGPPTDVQAAVTVLGRRVAPSVGPFPDLAGAQLTRVRLTGANLGGSIFVGASLHRARLDEADLNGAALGNAQLIDANLIDARLNGASLPDADLTGAGLDGASLQSANLYEANLTEVSARGARFADALMVGVNLRMADLSGADLSGVNLNAADLTNADLRGANLKGAFLVGANLNGAKLAGANLQGSIRN
jgi:uncharacterized protein YjbI with pentapeptide repeats